MGFYLVLFSFVVLFSFIYTYSREKNVIFLSKIILFCLLFLPLALRKGIGTDYKNYVKIFNSISEGQNLLSLEPGWKFLNLIVLKCKLNVQWIFVLSAFFTVYFILKTPRKDSFIIVVLFYSLYYLEAYNIVRQCMAMSICWYAFLCFKENKNKKAYIYALMAISFHYASVIVLMCFFIMNKIHFSEKVFVFLLIFVFLLVQSGILLKALSVILSFTKYGVYLERLDLFSNLKSGGIGGLATFFVRSFILIAMYYSLPSYVSNKEKNYCKVMVLALFTFDLLGNSIFIFQRVRGFFFLSYMVLFIYVYHRKREMSKLQNFIYIFFFISYYLILKLFSGAGAIIPYTHI